MWGIMLSACFLCVGIYLKTAVHYLDYYTEINIFCRIIDFIIIILEPMIMSVSIPTAC